MRCPRCDVEMSQRDDREAGFVVVDVCPGCKGLWLDEGELDTLDDSIGSNAELMSYEPAEGERAALSCPRCEGVTLEAISPPEATEVVIDRCGSCHGFWLDAGELDHVRSALLAADSAANQDAEILARPAGWSWTKWLFYKLDRSTRGDLEELGRSGQLPHRM